MGYTKEDLQELLNEKIKQKTILEEQLKEVKIEANILHNMIAKLENQNGEEILWQKQLKL